MKYQGFLTLLLLGLIISVAQAATLFEQQQEAKTVEKQPAPPSETATVIAQANLKGKAATREGDASMTTKEYDDANYYYTQALNAYDEGLKVGPTQISLLLGKATALRRRVTVSIARAQAETATEKQAAMQDELQKDLRAGIEVTGKLLTGQAKKPIPRDPKEKQALQGQLHLARWLRSDFYFHLVTRYDAKEVDAALKAFQVLVSADIDANRKTQSQLRACKMLVEVKLFTKAASECQTVLIAQPENPEAKAMLKQIAASQKK